MGAVSICPGSLRHNPCSCRLVLETLNLKRTWDNQASTLPPKSQWKVCMFPHEYGVLGCGWGCVMGSEHFPAGWGSLMPHHRDLMLMLTGHARWAKGASLQTQTEPQVPRKPQPSESLAWDNARKWHTHGRQTSSVNYQIPHQFPKVRGNWKLSGDASSFWGQLAPNKTKIWGEKEDDALPFTPNIYFLFFLLLLALTSFKTSNMNKPDLLNMLLSGNLVSRIMILMLKCPWFKLQFPHFLANQCLTSQLFSHKMGVHK